MNVTNREWEFEVKAKFIIESQKLKKNLHPNKLARSKIKQQEKNIKKSIKNLTNFNTTSTKKEKSIW